MIYSPTENYRLLANYSYQDSTHDATDKAVGEAPNSRGYLRSDWRLGKDWHFDVQITWVGERKRPVIDPREPLDGYTTVDLVLRREHLFQNLDAMLTVRNLFDEDVREPSQAPSARNRPLDIPNDLPQGPVAVPTWS